MPALGSGYTLEDFLLRLERSPVMHMAPLYHEHRELFVHRADVFTKAVLAVSWDRALALVQAAYYSQPVAAETHRAVLARMLLHNRHVQATGAGALVPWRAALGLYSEAMTAHGATAPTRVTVSALRLLAPHRRWVAALGVLQIAQANAQLTKTMVLDAAHAAATPAAWQQSLALLQRLHARDPLLLSESIQSLRPPGSSALTSEAVAAQSLLPAGSGGGIPGAPTPKQRHVLRVLGDVVAAAPWRVALAHPLCHSYLTHLSASTTLPPQEKVAALTRALEPLPWRAALQLVVGYTEPELTGEEEWAALTASGPAAVEPAEPRRQRKLKQRRRKKKQKAEAETETTEGEESIDALVSTAAALGDEEAGSSGTAVTAAGSDVALAPLLTTRLGLLRVAPDTAAAMFAVLAAKMPSTEAALGLALTHSSVAGGTGTIGSATRHPVVAHALVRRGLAETEATGDADALRTVAVPVLLAQSHHPTPTDLLSALMLKLRQARAVGDVVALLRSHVVPTGGRLTPEALEAVYACVLAHNNAVQEAKARAQAGGATPSATTTGASIPVAVHWQSALSWALDLQAPLTEGRVRRTGTGASGGAVSVRPEERVGAEPPLSPRMLSLLLHLCVQANSPSGALRAMGYARRVSKTELRHADAVRALLYCMMYDRPYEAEALVRKAERDVGVADAAPLRRLLEAMQTAMQSPQEPEDGAL